MLQVTSHSLNSQLNFRSVSISNGELSRFVSYQPVYRIFIWWNETKQSFTLIIKICQSREQNRKQKRITLVLRWEMLVVTSYVTYLGRVLSLTQRYNLVIYNRHADKHCPTLPLLLRCQRKKSLSEEFDIGCRVIHKLYELKTKTMYGIF